MLLHFKAFNQSSNSGQCHSIGMEENRFLLHVDSKEVPVSGSSFDLELKVISQFDQTWNENVFVTAPTNFSIQNTSAQARLSSTTSVVKDESLDFQYKVSFDPTNLPYYYQEIKILLEPRDTIHQKSENIAYIYFTPYNTIEIFNESDFIKSKREWLPVSNVYPPRTFIHKDSIPLSNITSSDTMLTDNELKRVFMDGLGYAVTVKVPLTATNTDESNANNRSWENTYRFNIENCRFFVWTQNDNGNWNQLPVSFAKVKVWRARDIKDTKIISTDYFTDKQGYMVDGSGNRKINFTYTSYNDRIRIYLELELESSDGKLEVELDGQWGVSDMVTNEVSIRYDEQNKKLNFGDIEVGGHEGARQYSWANNAWRNVEYAMGEIIGPGLEIQMKDCDQCNSNFKWLSGVAPTIYISRRSRNSERTLWHEFGHFVMRWLQNGNDQSNTGGTHSFSVNNSSPQLTITEGFANGFAFIMDEILFWMDNESGLIESERDMHGIYRTLVSTGGGRLLNQVHHPYISELMYGVALLDLWDGPNNYASYIYPAGTAPNRTTLFDDGGQDNFEMTLKDILLPFKNSGTVIEDVPEYFNALLTGNCERDASIKHIFDINNFTGLGADGVDMLLTDITHEYYSYDNNTWSRESGQDYTYTYTLSDIRELNSSALSFNLGIPNVKPNSTINFINKYLPNYKLLRITEDLNITNGAILSFNQNTPVHFYAATTHPQGYNYLGQRVNIILDSPAPNTSQNFTICRNTTLTTQSGGKIILGDPSNTAYSAIVTKESGSKIILENDSDLEVNNESHFSLNVKDPLISKAGSRVTLNRNSQIIQNAGSYMELSGTTILNDNSRIYVNKEKDENAVCEISGPLNIFGNSQIIVTGKIVFKSTAVVTMKYQSKIIVESGAYICVEPGAQFILQSACTLQVKDGANILCNNPMCNWNVTGGNFIKQNFTVNAGNDKPVENGDYVEIGQTNNPSYSYSWTIAGNNTVISTERKPFVSPCVTTTYTLQAWSDKTYKCESATDNVTVNVLALVADAGDDIYSCSIRNGSIRLGSTPLPNLSYSWSPSDFLVEISGDYYNNKDGDATNDPNPAVVGLTNTTTYTLTVSDQCGNQQTDEVIVYEKTLSGTQSLQDICYSGTGYISDKSINVSLNIVPQYSYSWSMTYTGEVRWRWDSFTRTCIPYYPEITTIISNTSTFCVLPPNYPNLYFTLTITDPQNKCSQTMRANVIIDPSCSTLSSCGGKDPDYVWKDIYYDKIIDQNTTLANTEYEVFGTLRIRNANLTLQNVIFRMGSCAKIIVEETASLSMISSLIIAIGTDDCPTGLRWQGVEVWGNLYSESSVVRGKVSMLNSEIRHADIALFAGKRENGVIDNSKSGGIIEFHGKNIFEDNGNDIIKPENPSWRERPEPPIEGIEFRKLYRGSASCEPNPFVPRHIIIIGREKQEIRNNTFDGENDDAILVEKSKNLTIHGNNFSENMNNAVSLKESKDFTIRENVFKVKDIAIKTEKSQTENGSLIAENTFSNNRIAIDLSDDDHSKSEISCNKMTYTEYGIHSINTYLKNQGTKTTGAGNTFISLETAPRLNHQLYHNGTGAVMTYFYDPVQPITLQTDVNLRANAVKSQRDNACLNSNARISEVTTTTLRRADTKEEQFSFELSPNPSEGIFTVTHNLDKETRSLFEITDLRGKKMLAIPANTIESDTKLNLTLLPRGMYLYRVREGERVIGNGRLVVVY